jgi:murein DD-endopeptidase MepM/ murein hydrolase activator NlpD
MINRWPLKLPLIKNWNYKENKPLVVVNGILALIAFFALLGRLFPPVPPPPELSQAPVFQQAPNSFLERIKGEIQRNMTLSDVLSMHDCPRELINQLVATARPLYNLKKLIVGNRFEIELLPDRRLNQFLYEIDLDKYLQVDLTQEGYKAAVHSIPYEIKTDYVEGTIQSSLFHSINRLNEGDQLAIDLADIFSCDLDFHTDLQPGDHFRLLVDKHCLNGKVMKYGKIKVAEFSNRGTVFSGYYFTDPAGKSDYYNAEGKSLRRDFLKSPLKFGRISSRFSRSRFHPILKKYRPHLGVDYAAPTGTPVVASASGRIQFAGSKGGFGRFVQISHSNGMTSMYGHLSRYGSGIHAGATVSQGEVIGFVGSTGLATGPHLDYRVSRGGRYVNPLSLRSVPPAPIKAEYLATFKNYREKWQSMLIASALPAGSQQVRLENPGSKP